MSSHRGVWAIVRERRSAVLVSTVVCALVLPGAALAQATRTWVSGVGDDANPCSRTAPCKTWAGAISKTTAGGEIDALDPGGFGAVTITKSITLDGGGGQVASVLVAGTNGITIAAGSNARVIIRNLRIDGLDPDGTNSSGGINGIDFVSGESLRLENDTIFGFVDAGVSDQNSQSNSLVVSNTTIEDNQGDGVQVSVGSGLKAGVVLENDQIEDNNCGVDVNLSSAATPVICATPPAVGGTANVTIANSSLSANTVDGLFSNGAGAHIFAVDNLVTGNALGGSSGFGLDPENGGQITSLCGNAVGGNQVDGSTTASLTAGCDDVGAAGPQGIPGLTGATGAAGATGSAGATGPPGLTGPQGVVGTSGAAGPAGAGGKTGKNGANGELEVVTCTKAAHGKTHCRGKLASGTVSFTISGDSVSGTLSKRATLHRGS